MGVVAGHVVVVVQKFTFAISSPDEFLFNMRVRPCFCIGTVFNFLLYSEWLGLTGTRLGNVVLSNVTKPVRNISGWGDWILVDRTYYATMHYFSSLSW